MTHYEVVRHNNTVTKGRNYSMDGFKSFKSRDYLLKRMNEKRNDIKLISHPKINVIGSLNVKGVSKFSLEQQDVRKNYPEVKRDYVQVANGQDYDDEYGEEDPIIRDIKSPKVNEVLASNYDSQVVAKKNWKVFNDKLIRKFNE